MALSGTTRAVRFFNSPPRTRGQLGVAPPVRSSLCRSTLDQLTVHHHGRTGRLAPCRSQLDQDTRRSTHQFRTIPQHSPRFLILITGKRLAGTHHMGCLSHRRGVFRRLHTPYKTCASKQHLRMIPQLTPASRTIHNTQIRTKHDTKHAVNRIKTHILDIINHSRQSVALCSVTPISQR
jgi:hypothetical protein